MKSPGDPIAFFVTWTTYGSWLPGDERGWVERPGMFRGPDNKIQTVARSLLTEDPCVLDMEQRNVVEKTITEHCTIRGWQLHAVNCRFQHVHGVVTSDVHPKKVVAQFKEWCTRHLKDLEKKNGIQPIRLKWWTEGCSGRWINGEDSLERAIFYVRKCQ